MTARVGYLAHAGNGRRFDDHREHKLTIPLTNVSGFYWLVYM